jgi:hypothetical protein
MSPSLRTAFSAAALALLTAAVPATASASGLRTTLTARPLSAAPEPGDGLPELPWRDKVIRNPTAAAAVRAAPRRQAANPPHLYRLHDGHTVTVTLSGSYTDSPAVPRSYVDFLDGLPHGPELRKLSIYIAPQEEVQQDCGGDESVLACYTPQGGLMIVPGNETASYGGVTTKFVVAHEYGHHIAAHRRNAPFDHIYRRFGGTVAFGPKYWSSEERVCAGAERVYFPGDEGDAYIENPGEAWAETYANLVFPGQVKWMYTPALQPTAGSLAAARRDVVHPWRHDRRRTFTGRLGADHRRETVHFALHLDGDLHLKLAGPRHSDYDLVLRSGPNHAATGAGRDDGSADHISYAEACRAARVAHVRVTVIRRRGHGPFRLHLRYAG